MLNKTNKKGKIQNNINNSKMYTFIFFFSSSHQIPQTVEHYNTPVPWEVKKNAHDNLAKLKGPFQLSKENAF